MSAPALTSSPANSPSRLTGYSLSKAVADIPRGAFKSESKPTQVSARSMKAIFRVLADYYPRVFPAVATIAEQSGVGCTTARLALRELKRQDWITEQLQEGQKPKAGGAGCTVEYVLNVGKVSETLDRQRTGTQLQQKRRQKPNGSRCVSPTENPTDSDQKATDSAKNPTDSEQKATEPVAEQNREGTINREEKNNAGKATAHFSSSEIHPDLQKRSSENEQRGLARKFFVWLNKTYCDLSLNRKSRNEIERFILSTALELPILQTAAREILDALDLTNSFERGQAPDKLSTNLPDRYQAVWEECEQRRRDVEALERASQQYKERADREDAEREAKKAEEEGTALSDEELFSQGPASCAGPAGWF